MPRVQALVLRKHALMWEAKDNLGDAEAMDATPEFRKTGPPNALDDIETHKLVCGLTADYSKQVTTLATGTILLSATFIKDIIKYNIGTFWSLVLVASWLLFFLSIVLGFLVQGKLTGNLWDKNNPNIYDTGLSTVWSLQAASFFFGVFLFAALAGINFIWPPGSQSAGITPAAAGTVDLQLTKNSTTTLTLDKNSVYSLKVENGKIVIETKLTTP